MVSRDLKKVISADSMERKGRCFKVEVPGVGAVYHRFLPDDRGLHRVSHHQKLNVPAIPKEEGRGSKESCSINQKKSI